MAEVLLTTTAVQVRPRLLVVEDDQTIRSYCQRLLRLTYETEAVANGQEAMAILRERPFDLVLADLQMPVVGGMELLQHVRQHHPDVDAIILTAHATVDTAREAMKLGALDYLSKPIDAEQLERTVRTALELRRTRKEKERLSDLVVMYQFSQLIATSLDVEQQAQQITQFLWQRFSPSALVLSLIDPNDLRLHLLAARAVHGAIPRPPAIPLHPEFTPEDLIQAHLRLVNAGTPAREETFCGVVLRTHDRAIGYLHVMRNADAVPFDANDRRLLSVFASQIAASLDNARLYQELKEQNRQTIEALAEAIDARDAYTYGHSRQVTRYALRLAELLGLEDDTIALLDYACLLHDIGKIGVRDYVLLKPGPLSNEEFAVMKRHPQIGVRIIERIHGLQATLPTIRHHHERFDGKGYPDGLQGAAIPIEARIVAIADAFEAMTSERAYRPAMDTETALQILLDGSGKQWDPQLVELFIQMIRSEGARLKLADRPTQAPVPLIAPEAVRAVMDVRD
jgi:putative nucleotidyltransferase with HDIG domain